MWPTQFIYSLKGWQLDILTVTTFADIVKFYYGILNMKPSIYEIELKPSVSLTGVQVIRSCAATTSN